MAFACKVLAFNRCHYTLFSMLTGGARTEYCAVSLRLSPLQIVVMITAITFVCCMIAMLLGLWARVNGSNPQVLQARADALRAEQEKARIAAANRERDRISATIQGEASETLHAVIDQTSQELDEIDGQIAAGETPSPSRSTRRSRRSARRAARRSPACGNCSACCARPGSVTTMPTWTHI